MDGSLLPLLGFFAAIAAAYWFFALAPYRQGRAGDLLSPEHISRPAIPEVLERYATFEWATQACLTSFGYWLLGELVRQGTTLSEVAHRADLSLDQVLDVVYADRWPESDSSTVVALIHALKANEDPVRRLQQAEPAASVARNRIR